MMQKLSAPANKQELLEWKDALADIRVGRRTLFLEVNKDGYPLFSVQKPPLYLLERLRLFEKLPAKDLETARRILYEHIEHTLKRFDVDTMVDGENLYVKKRYSIAMVYAVLLIMAMLIASLFTMVIILWTNYNALAEEVKSRSVEKIIKNLNS